MYVQEQVSPRDTAMLSTQAAVAAPLGSSSTQTMLSASHVASQLAPAQDSRHCTPALLHVTSTGGGGGSAGGTGGDGETSWHGQKRRLSDEVEAQENVDEELSW